jgi:hypothetical protein
MIGTSSSGARVDLPGTPAEVSASAAAPSVVGEGSMAIEGQDAGAGPGADAMDAAETEQV